jgi:RNA polymerase sigma-70 factor, ECF subfamily
VDERAWVERAARGDQDAFELLVRRHAEAAWRLARSLLGNDHEAEDAVQDTLIKAYRSLRSFRGESSFRTWLLSICHRRCLDRLRLKGHDVVSLEPALAQAREAEDSDIRMVLGQLLAGIPLEEREAFVLVHVLSYSREEAARICGVPASTMRSRVTRARERLAERLRESEWEGNEA